MFYNVHTPFESILRAKKYILLIFQFKSCQCFLVF